MREHNSLIEQREVVKAIENRRTAKLKKFCLDQKFFLPANWQDKAFYDTIDLSSIDRDKSQRRMLSPRMTVEEQTKLSERRERLIQTKSYAKAMYCQNEFFAQTIDF